MSMTQTPFIHYKYLIFIGMLSITLMLASALLVNRILNIDGFYGPGGILIFPLMYVLADVITEVYGYKLSRHILWCGLICQIIFSLLIFFVLKLPTSPFFHEDNAFHIVLSHLPLYAISFTIGTVFGGFMNIYIIAKFKILMKGKFFIFRSLLSTGIGEGIFTLITLGPVLLMHNSFSQVISILVGAYLFKLFYGALFIVPAALLVSFLKKSEKVDAYDYVTNFNPFKLSTE